MQRNFDILIWGATGFTGKIVTQYMVQNYTGGNLTWALGGRSETKLQDVKTAVNAPSDIDIVVADAHNPDEMDALVQRARVVLTTVGPYARYGSELVAACAKHGTHYCDLTGEVHWMSDMIDQHQQAAVASGAKIVHTCGFDSIPSDLGVYFLQQAMQQRYGVPAQEIKYRTKAFKGGFSGGTVDSMMAMMEAAKQDPSILECIADPYALNRTHRGHDGLDSNQHYYDTDFSSWVGPFVMSTINTRVVRRSNELINMAYGSDFRYNEGSLTKSGPQGQLAAAVMGVGTASINALTAFEPIRHLLQKVLPKPGEGPSQELMDKGFFEIELLAKHADPAIDNLRATVKGDRDPGYGSTAKMLAESAVCLAQDELPVGGGFWTPASAMGDSLLQRLPANAGVTFELI